MLARVIEQTCTVVRGAAGRQAKDVAIKYEGALEVARDEQRHGVSALIGANVPVI